LQKILISHHLIRPIAAPSSASAASAHSSSQLNRAALSGLGLKGLPVKPEFLNNSKAVSMDDSVETKRKLEKLGDMPAVDMTMADGEAAVGDLDADDGDDEEANRMDQALKSKSNNAMDVDEDEEVDPLDAFMSGVKEEVKKVNEEDLMKMGDAPAKRSRIRLDERIAETTAEDLADQIVPDELDATNLNPEDILALAARKAKKKDLAVVDHTRIRYEPFRKEFYVPPPDVATMTEEEVELLRLELDGIKIRGVDCPKPITKWSHYGLPANWCALIASSLCANMRSDLQKQS
jgi:ATP-dependent RNA helicase DDX46/PRP5